MLLVGIPHCRGNSITTLGLIHLPEGNVLVRYKKMEFRKSKMAQSAAVIAILSLLLVSVVSGITYFGWQINKQTSLQEEQAQADKEKTPEDKSVASKSGEVTVLKVYAQDKESNTNAQVAVPAFFYTKKDGIFGDYIGSSASTTLSATASTSISPVTIGSTVCGNPFNGTGTNVGFYGEEKCQEIKTEGETLQLDTHTICTAIQMQGLLFSDSTTTNANMSLGTSGSNSFDHVEIRVNGTDCAYNLAGFYVDTIAATNLDNIDLGSDTSSMTEKNVKIQRVKEKANYVFELDTPLMMHENVKYKTGSLTLKADGDGCSTSEAINISAFDKSSSQSAKGSRPILSGRIEDDQDSPVDVGGADIQIVSSGRRASSANAQNADGTSTFYCNP